MAAAMMQLGSIVRVSCLGSRYHGQKGIVEQITEGSIVVRLWHSGCPTAFGANELLVLAR